MIEIKGFYLRELICCVLIDNSIRGMMTNSLLSSYYLTTLRRHAGLWELL
jgi:hypothetical protein